MQYDLSGVWKWPNDLLVKRGEGIMLAPGVSEEAKEKIRKRFVEGKTWFVDPDHFEEAVESRDREYARRLKDLYWGKVE